ncbi:tetratricopeptide repeat protein [Streptomyces sp. WAC04114]|uniref:tetratricopeptide repeat protein n=1 Tax=Streptomyces sp. WAC04114 TaxID=2867961 RepID=UPI001C8CE0B6|nr:tetratricopeptide repeat protein [Streptomyces sp. WAC04114]MBX9361798.1 tetratricopeptide repeat protein [Streptomyces sp. WAC04114]
MVGDEGNVSNTISGGVFFHAVIQGRDITVQLPSKVTPALSGLPAASPTFTGRDTEVSELLQGLAPGGGRQRAVLVAAVAGLAGVGKTELVVQTATRALREPGWFPGGVLFVDLFGYDPERCLSAEGALDGLLRALGMPGEHIPIDLQGRARLYRSVLATFAQNNQRILVVIDNASSAEQARLLLPTDGTTAALLTSRHILDIDARLHDLDILDERASIQLLGQALHQTRGPADTRIQDAPADAADIARLCAGLPLALRIAAALLADTPGRPVASLANALKAEHTRLNRLRREDRAVRAAFDLSYQRLDSQHARLFRLLPLNPGPEISTEATACLATADWQDAEELLQNLARAHLVEPGHSWGRWRLHDLVRLYADEHGRTHADADKRDAARTHLFHHYEITTQAADTHLTTLRSSRSPRFPDRAAALAWLEDERRSLIATAITAPAVGHPGTGIALASSLAQFLDYRRSFNDWITVTTSALAVCRELGSRSGEGAMLNNLGIALREAGRAEEAIEVLTQAATLFSELGDRHHEGRALTNLGGALTNVDRFEEAIDALTQDLAICRELGDLHGQGVALTGLALIMSSVDRVEEAIPLFTSALAIFRELGDRQSEEDALNGLGRFLLQMDRFDEAIEILTQDLAICREFGDHHREADTLNVLGVALQEVCRFEEAIEVLTRAASLFSELGDRHGEGRALTNLGPALRQVCRFEEAIEVLTQAATLFRELGDRHHESAALINLDNARSQPRKRGRKGDWIWKAWWAISGRGSSRPGSG